MTYGLTPTGFAAKTQETIAAEIAADVQSALGATLAVDDDSALGQLIDIVAAQTAEVWEVASAIYRAHDADASEGDALDIVAQYTGTTRIQARPTRVLATCTLDAGTYAVGSLRAHMTGRPETVFSNESEIVTASDGDVGVWFACAVTGPVVVPAGSLEVIASPVVGWDAVTNDDVGVTGRDRETDAALRVRREQELAVAGAGTYDAILGEIRQRFSDSGLGPTILFVNRGDYYDDLGLPPHSVELLVDRGATVTEAALAEALYAVLPAGIASHGTESYTVTSDVDPDHEELVRWSEPDDVEIDVEIQIVIADGADAPTVTTAVTEALTAYVSGVAIGGEVRRAGLVVAAMSVSGVVDVELSTLTVGPAGSPVAADLVLGVRQRAVLGAGLDLEVLP